MAEDSKKPEKKQFLYRNERGDGLNSEGILQARRDMRDRIQSLIRELAVTFGVAPDALHNAEAGISVPPLPPDLPKALQLAIASNAACRDLDGGEANRRGGNNRHN